MYKRLRSHPVTDDISHSRNLEAVLICELFQIRQHLEEPLPSRRSQAWPVPPGVGPAFPEGGRIDTGEGVGIELSIYDNEPGDNSGGLDVTILPAVMGDTNVNGVVDLYDYRNLVAQFGGPPGDESADFNGDGVVDLYDFTILRENFDPGSASAPTGESGATAPEPATFIVLASGFGLLLRRHSNRRSC